MKKPSELPSRRRATLAVLAVGGIAVIVLLAIVNYFELAAVASSLGFASGVRLDGPMAGQPQRSSDLLEEIVDKLRAKRFVDAANRSADAAQVADAQLLAQAEDLLVEKLRREKLEAMLEPPTDSREARRSDTEQFPGDHDGSEMHLVFSMSCDHRNRLVYQTILQLTATWAGQRGPITQILSGCSVEARERVLREPTFYYDYRRHFTPDYSVDPEPGFEDDYMAYNKPFAFRHFLHHAVPAVTHEVVALIDGDFFFFRPLEVNTGRNVSRYYAGSRDPVSVNDSVVDGWAVAQDWTNVIQGGFYAADKEAALSKACDGQPCAKVSREDGAEYFANIGPPYIMTLKDAKRFVHDYCHLCVTARTVSSEWMTEMFAYSLAAANHGIKHTMLTNLGVTAPAYAADDHEYWGFVDVAMGNPCADDLDFVMPSNPPVTLHTCQRIHNYYKSFIPDSIAACDSQLLKNLPTTDWTEVESQVEAEYWVMRRQEVWAKCSAVKIMNRAIIELKQRTCPNGFNTFRGIEPLHRDM